MINWDKFGNKRKYILIGLCVVLAIITIIYIFILVRNIKNNMYISQLMNLADKTESTDFAVRKIYLASSANAVDESIEKKMNNLSIYQYTDMVIYIDNFKSEKGLTNENTIKELYIDNISLLADNSEIGYQSLNYTNLLKVGNREAIKDFSKQERIDFNIVRTNEENENANYEQPTFYADCSNPITLKYINKFLNSYSLKNDEVVSFDGSILKTAGIKTEDIRCKVIFKINIVNNEDEYSSCWINIPLPLSDIYQGTTIKSTTASGEQYNFF